MTIGAYIQAHQTVILAGAGYLVMAIYSSSPAPGVKWTAQVWYKWARDAIGVLLNQHRDMVSPQQPAGPAKE